MHLPSLLHQSHRYRFLLLAIRQYYSILLNIFVNLVDCTFKFHECHATPRDRSLGLPSRTYLFLFPSPRFLFGLFDWLSLRWNAIFHTNQSLSFPFFFLFHSHKEKNNNEEIETFQTGPKNTVRLQRIIEESCSTQLWTIVQSVSNQANYTTLNQSK